ncbi:MAG: tetraacyldisaccharide 4'-kinase [Pseudomonadota bacterium]
MKAALEKIWWRSSPPPWPLRLLEPLYAGIADALAARRKASAVRLPVPVIVIGNIAIGGTGKTPVTLALIEMLRALGAKPGVLSRGYGGEGPFPLLVTLTTAPQAAGDEPVLMAQRSGVPLCVAPSRAEAGLALLTAHPDVDVLLCDDGLQHYVLARDLEFCVVDGARGHGNGHRLPAGPLREATARAAQCALLLVNGANALPYGERALRFDLVADQAVQVYTGERRALAHFTGQQVQAVAGIGNPQRFFDLLTAQGMVVRPHAFADHHAFTAADLAFTGEAPVLMTEKDAVKCRLLKRPVDSNLWSVPVTAVFSRDAHERVQECLRTLLALRRSTP